MQRSARLTAMAAMLLALSARAGADDARALLVRVHELNHTTRKWEDRTQRMAVIITDRRGGEYNRDMEVFTRRYGDDDSRTLLFFHAPAQVQGIGFLQWISPNEPDRQWLYLPGLKRTRQINGGGRTESFVGTDFNYEDLAIMGEVLDWSAAKAAATLAGEETVDGQPCDILELTPTPAADIHYKRLRLWLGRDDQVVHRYQFFDEEGALAKTLQLSDIRLVGAIPSAYKLEMHNERAGSHTTVEISDLKYNTGLADDVFTQRRLERGP